VSIKYDAIDKIIINNKDIKQLLTWRDNNKELVRNFMPVLTEGVIIYENNYRQYFKQEGDIIRSIASIVYNEKIITKVYL